MIAAILANVWPYLAAGGAALVALVVAYFKIGSDATAKERAKTAQRTIAAKDEQLEMYREATKAERDAAALSDEEAMKEAERWASRR